MPVDMAYPKKRMLHIYSRTACNIVITDAATKALLTALIQELQLPVKHIFLIGNDGSFHYEAIGNDEHGALFFTNEANPPLANEGTDSAYVFYTSGSTGEPKAILGIHQSLHHFIAWEKKGIRNGVGNKSKPTDPSCI